MFSDGHANNDIFIGETDPSVDSFFVEGLSVLAGLSPWALADFRSQRRPMAGVQDFFNRKGLLSEKLEKKQAFDVVRGFYAQPR